MAAAPAEQPKICIQAVSAKVNQTLKNRLSASVAFLFQYWQTLKNRWIMLYVCCMYACMLLCIGRLISRKPSCEWFCSLEFRHDAHYRASTGTIELIPSLFLCRLLLVQESEMDKVTQIKFLLVKQICIWIIFFFLTISYTVSCTLLGTSTGTGCLLPVARPKLP